MRTHPEVDGLLEPEHPTIPVDQDRRGDREVTKRAAPRREVPLLNIVEPVNCESRISHQPDGPIVRPLERPQLVDTIRTHGHKLYTERLEVLGELIELGQLRDTVRAPISTIKLQQKGRPSEIRKTEFLAIGVQPKEIRSKGVDRHGGLLVRQSAGEGPQQKQ